MRKINIFQGYLKNFTFYIYFLINKTCQYLRTLKFADIDTIVKYERLEIWIY